jgi:hypothetical protein
MFGGFNPNLDLGQYEVITPADFIFCRSIETIEFKESAIIKKHGGKLILKDPSFHSNYSFHPPEDYGIETRKNRLIVAPAYVWHEVSPYIGDEDRITVVVNLHLDNLQV